MTSWGDWYEIGQDLFIEYEDPDDWEGNEAEYCIEMDRFAFQHAEDNYDPEDDWPEDDDDCDHENVTQASDGATYCDRCGALVDDISDDEFAEQHGANFSPGAFKGW